MTQLIRVIAFAVISVSTSLPGQAPGSPSSEAQTTLRVSSRAVLVDVLVTDHKGKPVTGLRKDDFTVTEQGRPQTLSFFEEHKDGSQPVPAQIPKLPPNVFSNFSPYPLPPAVNVLLLDSLNTRMESQSFVHSQAIKFLKSAKPGSRMAIFTMGLGLHFIQGFTDDPALLMAALNNKKNNEVQPSVMIKGQDETNAQANIVGMMQAPISGGGTAAPPEMTEALKRFFAEQEISQNFDRGFVTLANLQRLATFLTAFPGRKNVIWFTESIPAFFSIGSSNDLATMSNNPGFESEYKKTMNLLAAARVALYPVDARGTATVGFYQADNKIPSATSRPYQIIGVDNAATGASGASSPGAQVAGLNDEDMKRNSDQIMQESFAQDSGGKAFANTNGLSDVIDKIRSTSSNFYTLSYTPINPKMDGAFRKIEVKVGDGEFSLSYRRGYFAIEEGLPGSALAERNRKIQKLNAKNPAFIDPLLPFMDLGMPQAQQILFEARIQPASANDQPSMHEAQTAPKPGDRYTVAFAIDLKDLRLKLDPDGNHKGKLNISLIAYDRYGNIGSRNDQIIALDIKPDVYAFFQNYGVQFNADIAVPKGQFWLRTGIYDQATQRVGTMEIPLTSVTSTTVSTK
jgi:VWFA-related protein